MYQGNYNHGAVEPTRDGNHPLPGHAIPPRNASVNLENYRSYLSALSNYGLHQGPQVHHPYNALPPVPLRDASSHALVPPVPRNTPAQQHFPPLQPPGVSAVYPASVDVRRLSLPNAFQQPDVNIDTRRSSQPNAFLLNPNITGLTSWRPLRSLVATGQNAFQSQVQQQQQAIVNNAQVQMQVQTQVAPPAQNHPTVPPGLGLGPQSQPQQQQHRPEDQELAFLLARMQLNELQNQNDQEQQRRRETATNPYLLPWNSNRSPNSDPFVVRYPERLKEEKENEKREDPSVVRYPGHLKQRQEQERVGRLPLQVRNQDYQSGQIQVQVQAAQTQYQHRYQGRQHVQDQDQVPRRPISSRRGSFGFGRNERFSDHAHGGRTGDGRSEIKKDNPSRLARILQDRIREDEHDHVQDVVQNRLEPEPESEPLMQQQSIVHQPSSNSKHLEIANRVVANFQRHLDSMSKPGTSTVPDSGSDAQSVQDTQNQVSGLDSLARLNAQYEEWKKKRKSRGRVFNKDEEGWFGQLEVEAEARDDGAEEEKDLAREQELVKMVDDLLDGEDDFDVLTATPGSRRETQSVTPKVIDAKEAEVKSDTEAEAETEVSPIQLGQDPAQWKMRKARAEFTAFQNQVIQPRIEAFRNGEPVPKDPTLDGTKWRTPYGYREKLIVKGGWTNPFVQGDNANAGAETSRSQSQDPIGRGQNQGQSAEEGQWTQEQNQGQSSRVSYGQSQSDASTVRYLNSTQVQAQGRGRSNTLESNMSSNSSAFTFDAYRGNGNVGAPGYPVYAGHTYSQQSQGRGHGTIWGGYYNYYPGYQGHSHAASQNRPVSSSSSSSSSSSFDPYVFSPIILPSSCSEVPTPTPSPSPSPSPPQTAHGPGCSCSPCHWLAILSYREKDKLSAAEIAKIDETCGGYGTLMKLAVEHGLVSCDVYELWWRNRSRGRTVSNFEEEVRKMEKEKRDNEKEN